MVLGSSPVAVTLTFLFPMNYQISFCICSTPKLSKAVTLLALTYKATQWVPIDSYSSRFFIYIAHPLL